MFSYKVFLTKSSEAAHAISRGTDFGSGANEARINSANVGMVNEDSDFIPAIYHNKGYFYCAIEYITEETKPSTYNLVIC